MPSIYLANTDHRWFDFLKASQPHSEVNFWKPSHQNFKAVSKGELFAFRLTAPRNLVGGYGVLVSSLNVTIQFAWDSLGISNGHASMSDMLSSIAKYRSDRKIDPQSVIGARLLANPIFFDESDWFEVPEDWSPNIVTGKVYNTNSITGATLWDRLMERTPSHVLFSREEEEAKGLLREEGPRFAVPQLITPRLGQGLFRVQVASAYRFECAVSDTKVAPALEAAHIIPYSVGGAHQIQNGIFLRRDIHSVLDSGFATLSDDYRFHVSGKIRSIFNNGNEYLRLHGQRLKLPDQTTLWPAKNSIRWHQSERYIGD